MNDPVQLLVGLGNPGAQYHQTRHNAGADFVAEVARQYGANLVPDSKFFGLSARILVDNKDLRLLIPTTFMNRSGQAIGAMANFFKIAPENILVAHDELDLEPGIARLKLGGGHGGHNGLRDTISALGNNKNFARLRLGIGHPGNAKQVANYVLQKAPALEFKQIEDASYQATTVLPDLVRGDWNKAMKNLHTSNT